MSKEFNLRLELLFISYLNPESSDRCSGLIRDFFPKNELFQDMTKFVQMGNELPDCRKLELSNQIDLMIADCGCPLNILSLFYSQVQLYPIIKLCKQIKGGVYESKDSR
jgi:hypothetical protein